MVDRDGSRGRGRAGGSGCEIGSGGVVSERDINGNRRADMEGVDVDETIGYIQIKGRQDIKRTKDFWSVAYFNTESVSYAGKMCQSFCFDQLTKWEHGSVGWHGIEASARRVRLRIVIEPTGDRVVENEMGHDRGRAAEQQQR